MQNKKLQLPYGFEIIGEEKELEIPSDFEVVEEGGPGDDKKKKKATTKEDANAVANTGSASENGSSDSRKLTNEEQVDMAFGKEEKEEPYKPINLNEFLDEAEIKESNEDKEFREKIASDIAKKKEKRKNQIINSNFNLRDDGKYTEDDVRALIDLGVEIPEEISSKLGQPQDPLQASKAKAFGLDDQTVFNIENSKIIEDLFSNKNGKSPVAQEVYDVLQEQRSNESKKIKNSTALKAVGSGGDVNKYTTDRLSSLAEDHSLLFAGKENYDKLKNSKDRKERENILKDIFNSDTAREFIDDEGNYIDKSKLSRAELNKQAEQTAAKVNEYSYMAPNELYKAYDDVENELVSLGSQLFNKGEEGIMSGTSLMQKGNEFFMNLGFDGETYGKEGKDKALSKDMLDLETMRLTGEAPKNLTFLPKSDNILVSKYNKKLKEFQTLQKAIGLNVDLTSLERSSTSDILYNESMRAFGFEPFSINEMQNLMVYNINQDRLGIKANLAEQGIFGERGEEYVKQPGQLLNTEMVISTIPGFTMMGLEVAGTYMLLGGAGGLGRVTTGIGSIIEANLLRTPLSAKTAEVVGKFTAGVMYESVGLTGSNIIGSNVFGREKMAVVPFAGGATFARMGGNWMLNTTGNAIKNLAVQNRYVGNVVNFLDKLPGGSTIGGAIKFAAKPAIGATSIKAGEFGAGLVDVAEGEMDFTTLWHEIKDADAFWETYGALLFMASARPDTYTQKVVENFHKDIIKTLGNEKQIKGMANQIGVDFNDLKIEDTKNSAPASSKINEALNSKKLEIIKDESLTEEQKQVKIEDLQFVAGRLKVINALYQVNTNVKAENWNTKHKNLQLTIKSLGAGNAISPKDIVNIAEAGFSNNGTSVVLEFMDKFNMSEGEANRVFKQCLSSYTQASRYFKDPSSKNFNSFLESTQSEGNYELEKAGLQQQLKDKVISKATYEAEVSKIEDNIILEQTKQSTLIDIAKGETDARIKETLDYAEEVKTDGSEILELSSDKFNELKAKQGGKTDNIGYGFQTVVDGKTVFVMNKDAMSPQGGVYKWTSGGKEYTAKGFKGSTVKHELFHPVFERKFDAQAIENRVKERVDKGMSEEQARSEIRKEDLEYIDAFKNRLKELGIFNKIEQEMLKRPDYKKLIQFNKRDVNLEKEFINEFIEAQSEGELNTLLEGAKTRKVGTEVVDLKNGADVVDFFIEGVDKTIEGKVKIKEALGEFDKLTGDKSSIQESTKLDEVKAKELAIEANGDINNLSKPQQESLVDQYRLLGLKALGFVEGKGIPGKPKITREEAVSFVDVYLPSIIRRYNNKKGDFSTMVFNNIKPKRQAFYGKQEKLEEQGKQKRLSDKVDSEGNREFDVADKDLNPLERLEAQEIKNEYDLPEIKEYNPLNERNVKPFEGEIIESVDITPIDATIIRTGGVKEIGKRYGDKIASIVYDIPESKLDPKNNLTYAKKYKDGVPEPSEAGNIQKAFSDANKVKSFIKNLPLTNVSSEQTLLEGRIKKDVSRDVYGYGLGIPNNILKLFYNKTGKRSKGLTSQTAVWELKPEFKGDISNESIKQFQDALGITGAGELNNYDRKIGQNLKGIAKLEGSLIANTVVRNKVSGMDIKSSISKEQLLADLKAGANKFQASEKEVEALIDIVDLVGSRKKVNIEDIIKYRKLKGKGADLIRSFSKPGSLAQMDQAIKNGTVSKVILNELYKMDLDSPETKRVLEDIKVGDIARREGITRKQVIERYVKNAWQKNAKELQESIGFKSKSMKDRGSKENFVASKPYILDFIQRSIPEGKTFADLPKAAQNMILKTLGSGDGTLSTSRKTKDGNWVVIGQQTNERPFTYKEYGLKEGETVELLKKVYELEDGDLVGKGKDNSEWVDEFYYPNAWGGKGRNILNIAGVNVPLPELVARFQKNYKGRKQKDIPYENILGANKKALKSLYNNMKEVVINSENPREALEHMIDLQLAQTNRASGGIKGLVGMESVTTYGERSNPKLPKLVHNEHLSELFSMTKDFSLAMDRYIKGEQTLESLDLQIERMVEDASQALITEKRRAIKDASGAAVRDYLNTLLFLGKDATKQVPLVEGELGEVENMLEIMRDKGVVDLVKQIKETPYDKLTEIGVIEKQKQVNRKSIIATQKSNDNLVKEAGLNLSEKMTTKEVVDVLGKRDQAIRLANRMKKVPKKIRVFDFDDTVGTSKNKVFATKDGKKKTLNAEQFAKKGLQLIDEGWKMDFSDFNKVTEGGKGPLFDLMKTMNEADGVRDIHILTARAPEAAPAIHMFLKEMGIDIPLENITGLGNSTGKAKADWLVNKAAEGYNDFYFADDAPQNVKAVRKALEVLDIKYQVQQARMLESTKLSEDFNKIIEEKTGIGAEKVFSDIKAEIRGKKKNKIKFFIPPSAEDFLGLLYTTLPKGSKGDAALKFYQKNLFDPYTRATDNLSKDRVTLMDDFKELKKQLEVPKDLKKQTESGFTNEQAVRVYLWNKQGQKIPGLSKTDLNELTTIIESNGKLKAFSDQILTLTKGDGYSEPGRSWQAGTITTDLIDLLNKTKRSKYLQQWNENVEVIFSKENMNKLEASFGPKYREAMENMLVRMRSGSNRTAGNNRLNNQVLDYINNSTGVTMFMNTRSALLQTISSANFTNWTFNNPLKMAGAFANQPQYWKDFMKLMNSDYLRDRRNGLKLNINESEIADAAKTSKNKAKAVLSYILEKGYLPTKMADSFAIASGGAMFYRNRIKDLMKNKGMSESEAEAQAMNEFRQVSEKSQQSSDPSKISMQQSGDLGRIILQYANTPMQYARIQKRAMQDIANGRGDNKENVSKIIYYGFLQNVMFNALQQGTFALGFGDDEEFSDAAKAKFKNDKVVDTMNGMLDSQLRGLGLPGVTVQVLKNLGIDIYKRSNKKRPEYSDAYYKLLEFSPAIKSKLSRIKGAAYPFDTKKRREEVFEKGFSLDNPAYESMAKVITATTNVPLDRAYQKIENLKHASDSETEMWEAIANVLGWPSWQLTPKEVNNASSTVEKEVPLTEEQKEKQKIQKEKEKAAEAVANYKSAINSTDHETLKKLTASQQKKMMKEQGWSDYAIKNAKKEEDRIALITRKNKGEEIKENKEDIDRWKYKSLTKAEQIKKLDSLGLGRNQIKVLKYEEDRVNKLLELMSKEQK